MADTAKAQALLQLIRFDKPIGTLLLLWPTLWALWIASDGTPSIKLLVVFVAGTFLTRSAGCIINDWADRKVDGAVARTSKRPLVTGAVSNSEALILFLVLMLMAFALVLTTNPLTISLSCVAVLLAATYPFMKRYTHFPQVVLGLAFSWGIPMAFAAELAHLTPALWWLFLGNLWWIIAYDTQYAMVDRDDDIPAGIKSTAIFFGRYDRLAVAACQALSLLSLYVAGNAFSLGAVFNLSLLVAAIMFVYQQYLIRDRNRDACFQAFLHNNWVGMAIFIGVFISYVV
ncbi:MAG: 4-hydroxybenzoate octaprenyltransferase [Pseudomonadota bacterium]